ncbi:hypothetical protein BRCH_02428c [Candidatus Burkholderia brachyanthoides]|nr:hypothetical protein BRCH_02428c [Candidatus Burkholderia brachyanthoides]
MRFGALMSVLSAAGLLAACASSPTSNFYTLAGASAGSGNGARQASSGAPFFFELAPVDMPSQVARNQLVLQTNPAQVKVLEEERWASLPADEVRRALSGDLTQRLGSIDVYGTSYPPSATVYRVKVSVQRFESWPGSQAVIDAVWSVRTTGGDNVLTCRTVAQETVGQGYSALVDGHRKAVDEIASAITAGVRSLNALPPASARAKNGAASRPAPVSPCPAASAATSASTSTDRRHARPSRWRTRERLRKPGRISSRTDP